MTKVQDTSPDVVEELVRQHEQVKTLFSQLEGATGDKLEDTFCELRRLLSVHETAEEEIIYPALRTLGDEGTNVAKARIVEEGEAKDKLAQLEKMEAGGAPFIKALAEFNIKVVEHAEREEHEVFPLLQRRFDADQLRKMGSTLRLAEAVAPTHPHPHGPDGAVGNLVLGPAVAIMDRVRDVIRQAS